MDTKKDDKPFRVGVFDTVEEADRAVKGLLGAGFRKEQLSVICSDKYKEQYFKDLPTPKLPGTYTPQAAAIGGAIGATIGGLLLAATALSTGGATLIAAGTVLLGGGAIAGTFTGAMATRGMQKENADYYDQAVQHGKILVGAEVHGAGKEARLADAERILARTGTEPVALVEG